MARLTELQRSKIVIEIQNPIIEKLNLVYKELGEILSSFIKELTPNEIFSFIEKYPEICNYQNYIYSRNISILTSKGINGFSIPLSIPFVPNAVDDFYKKLDKALSSIKIDQIIFEIKRLEKLQNEIKGKTRCVLSDINTYKQLKDQFPEAFEILMKIENKEQTDNNSSNKCDSIENLRAQLTKI